MSTHPVAAVRSDQGGHPHGNEDSAWVGRAVWLVADGMGGHVGGEVASATAIGAAREVLERRAVETLPSVDAARAAMREAVAAAAEALRARGEQEPELSTMGTTLVAAALAEDADGTELVVAHVGDSRGYLLSPAGAPDDEVDRLTRDDNVAEEMVALGLLDSHQAATHPGQYQLTKALTAYDDEAPEPTVVVVPARGRLLLCSDGLNGELSDTTIGRLLAEGSPDVAAQALLDAALRAPARDNVTVLVVDLG